MPRWPSLGGDRSPGDVLVPLLLAAFVIVVTSFLATVALDMGREQGAGSPATASVTFDAAADTITVRFTSMNRPGTSLDVTVRNATDDAVAGSVRLTRVGSSYAFDGLQNGTMYEVAVVAERNDRRVLLMTRSGTL